MTDREIDLIVGSLLHDIGKVIYRTGEDESTVKAATNLQRMRWG